MQLKGNKLIHRCEQYDKIQNKNASYLKLKYFSQKTLTLSNFARKLNLNIYSYICVCKDHLVSSLFH